jgi:hypothetical protein
VEGCRWGAVPDRGRLGAARLRILLRARLQPPGGRLLPWSTVLLLAGAGTFYSQLHNCTVDLYSFL